MDIDIENKDNVKKWWKQPHLMFEGEDHQALQTLSNNGTIIPDLTIIIAASSTASSVHQDTLNTQSSCTRCGKHTPETTTSIWQGVL